MLMTVAEVGEQLKVSSSFVYRLVQSGQLAVIRVGNGQGRIRIDETDLLAYVGSHREEGKRCLRLKQNRVRLQHLRLPSAAEPR